MAGMQISELARQTSVSVHALRHYERLGLIHPHRRANGYRDYPAGMRREVVFIAMSRQLGFGLSHIASKLDDYRSGNLGIDDMVQALQERVDAIDQHISQLQAQKTSVQVHQAWLREQAQTPTPKSRLPSARAAPWPRARPPAAQTRAVATERKVNATPSNPKRSRLP